MNAKSIHTGAELADDVPVAAKNIGISRAVAYREMKAGRLVSFTVGNRRKISRRAQAQYVEWRERESAPPFRPAAR
jgi:hypothetical protein